MHPVFVKIQQSIAYWAGKTPAAVALRAPSADDVSYLQLNEHIQRTVSAMHQLGYGADSRIALALPEGILLASALLCLSAASPILPVSDHLTLPELLTVMRKAGVCALFTTPGFGAIARTAAAQIGLPVVELATTNGKPSGLFSLQGVPALIPSHTGMQPDATAFILPTSGTTGAAKLVPISSHQFAASAQILGKALGVTALDVTLVTGSLNLIAAFSVNFLPVIVNGGCAVIAPFDIRFFIKMLEQYQPDWINTTPVTLNAIYEYLRTYPAPPSMTRMRFLRVGSAPFPAEKIVQLEQWLGIPVIQGYGLTESVTGITNNPLPPATRKHGTIGLPIYGEIAIIAEDGRHLPANQNGELAIRNEFIFTGYLNPEDNIPPPLIDGWLMTGDLAVRDEDGFVTIIGRRKEMINAGAMKILPREVEEAIGTHPGVADACVVPLPHPTLGEQVAAAVVRRSEAVTEGELIQHLKPLLARYKIPSAIYFVEKIPHSPGGKIQRQKVIEMIKDLHEHNTSADINVSDEPLQESILVIWHEVLGTQVISLTDHFIAIGGDSLSAVSLSLRLSNTCAVNFTLEDVFDFPTPAMQAEEIRRRLTIEVQSS